MESPIMMRPEVESMQEIPDLLLDAELESLSLNIQPYDLEDNNSKSFLIIDSQENLRLTNLESFVKKMGMTDIDKKVKVISIFGNAGDGKSHTLNHIFFDGAEIFKMSSEQTSCTLGIMGSYQPFFYNQPVLCIDTEGLQGVTQNENQQHRMLMKVLAISDVIIYRTRAERLNTDLYKFLASASKIYLKHFIPILQSLASSSASTASGPDVIIFHETRNTRPLESNVAETPEDVIRERFSEMKLNIDAFRSLKYVGIKTNHPPTDYNPLKSILKAEIENKLKPPRTLRSIYQLLVVLNDKFSGEIEETHYTFHEMHFTCEMVCEACNQRCEETKDHSKDGTEHKNHRECQYQPQLDNKIYLCKRCHLNGRSSIVKINNSNDPSWLGIAKYAWSMGSIQTLECLVCGEIYRAKWYGNKSPEEVCVLPEAVHIWRDGSNRSQTATHSAQAILDGFSYITETISSVGAQPTKSLTSWVADKIVNPAYWRPNSEIVNCKSCKIYFERNGLKIHHCRNCGEGFCSNCSRSRMAVPKRGWGTELVRVCNECRDELLKSENGEHNQENTDEESKIRVRKYGEVIANCVSSVAQVLEYPKDLIKDSARPSYWIPDSESPSCIICHLNFGNDIEEMGKSQLFYRDVGNASGSSSSSPVHSVMDIRRHHCRACGAAVCNKCSLNRRPVPELGWNTAVRVCDSCFKK